MIAARRLAWLQLRRQKVRLVVALCGVAFAVMLMLMQLGFRNALYGSALNVPKRLDADIVLLSPRYTFIADPGTLPRRRLYQALGFPGVRSVLPLYVSQIDWKNPINAQTRMLIAFGFDPARGGFLLPDAADIWREIRRTDAVVFDALSRPEYGPIAAMVEGDGAIVAEVNRREVNVRRTFRMGTSFAIDGSLIVSDETFLRLLPNRRVGVISLGLIRLEPGVDAMHVRDLLARELAPDVQVLTKDQLFVRELTYWAEMTPIGYIFAFGVVMGFVVGAIIVYQILFADIADHLPEYATLKAIGYTNRYLIGVVMTQALVLAVLGFVPAAAACSWFYRLTAKATGLPMALTPDIAALVFALTVVMCVVSGAIALRKLRSADPAEVFG